MPLGSSKKNEFNERRNAMRGWIRCAWVLILVSVIIAGCSPTKPAPTPTTVSFPTGAFVNGDWSWEFKADGSFVSGGPLGSESGTYSVSGDQVVITCQCCGDVEGTYTWSFDGMALKFTAIDDKCTNRKDVVDTSTWLKKP
jgi:hypothetical protein